MTIVDMHILIDQGLQSIGRFGDREVSHEEKDIAINAETILLLDKIFRDRQLQPATFEEDVFSADVTRVFKRTTELATDNYDTYSLSASIPETYQHLVELQVMYFSGTPSESVQVGKSYRAVTPTKVGNKWYKEGETFTVSILERVYGQIEQVDKTYNSARLLSSEKIHTVLESWYHRTRKESPVLEIINNRFKVHQNKFVVDAVNMTYCRLPATVVYPTVNSDLPENVQQWLVNKVISRLANITDQSQQKIQNLNTETIQ